MPREVAICLAPVHFSSSARTYDCAGRHSCRSGRELQRRLEEAKDSVAEQAQNELSLPAAPTPPAAKYAKVWVESPAKHSDFYKNWDLEPGYSYKYGDFDIKIPKGTLYTGRIRIHKRGKGSSRMHAAIDWANTSLGVETPGGLSEDELDIYEGVVSVRVNYSSPAVGFVEERDILVSAKAEVMRELPEYNGSYAQYHENVSAHTAEVARLINAAAAEVEPEREGCYQNFCL